MTLTEEPTVCFYPQNLPDVGEIVMVRISQITDAGVYCQLLEYGNTPGLIIVGELSKKKYINVTSLVKINKVEAATVLRVDKVRRYVDLSRKKVTQEEFTKCLKRYSCAKLCHNVLVYAAKKVDRDVRELYELFAYQRILENGSLYVYFTNVFANNLTDKQFDKYSDEEKQIFKGICEGLKRKFNVSKYKVQAEINCYNSGPEGMRVIKKAWKAAKEIDPKIHVALKSPPTYIVTLITTDKDNGLKYVQRMCEAAKKIIKDAGGFFEQVAAPIVHGEKGNVDSLCARMDQLYGDLLQEELSDRSSSSDTDILT